MPLLIIHERHQRRLVTVRNKEVFIRKLMIDGEGLDDSQKIDELFSTFIQWCDDENQTDEEITEGFDKLLLQLDQLKFSRSKSAAAQKANARQIAEFDEMFADMEKQVVEIKKAINQKQLELEYVKKKRLNKMKYDALGRIISSLPDRQESKKQLEKIQEDIKALKLGKEALEKKTDEREKHLGLLLTAAHELKEKLRKLEDWEGSESD